jgi:hypothetical protein
VEVRRVSAPTKRFCLRGHDTLVVGRWPNSGCRECATLRDRGEIPVGHHIPFGPLEERLLAGGSAKSYGPNLDRYIYRWRARGIPFYTADRVCCEVLGLHPSQVYGDAWFSFGEESAPSEHHYDNDHTEAHAEQQEVRIHA